MSNNKSFSAVVSLIVGAILIWIGMGIVNDGKEAMTEYGNQLEDIRKIAESFED